MGGIFIIAIIWFRDFSGNGCLSHWMVNTSIQGANKTSSPEIACILYKDLTLIRVNDAWCLVFGLAEDGVIGHSIFEFVPTLYHRPVRRDLLALGPDKRSALYQHPAGFGAHTFAWINWNFRVSLDQDGKVIMYDAVGHLAPERNRP